eukprot:CAMPEP_0202976502 /NCGR_PEP_ID=MMETSP1396-20130829/78013_1 /ASSEMBLY_ACC=CAM_ASM_000872 /TAXON_ID= /ORGANISM="Pseudokeronopsis sp., Strain Brazil" /LENGTH=42 /DNA_ID= /DNA_START= /DNA_END= /DNA_ORIENTATION=
MEFLTTEDMHIDDEQAFHRKPHTASGFIGSGLLKKPFNQQNE